MKLQHEDRYVLPVDVMFGVFSDPVFYEKRYSGGSARYEFLELGVRGGRFVIDVRQYLRVREGTDLPAVVRPFVRAENVLRTTMIWELAPDLAGAHRGTHSFRIEGVPVDVQGNMRLQPRDGGCVNHIDMEIRCNVPLIGGKIASMIGNRAERMLARNDENTRSYLRERGLASA